MKRVIIICFVSFLCSAIIAQNKRICVVGSSSAYGYFPNTYIPRDSSWAFKISKHYKDVGIIDTLYNIGTPGIDCYTTMPSGYVPPSGRNLPNSEFNITKAVNFSPKPDVIIINLPSNNYTVLSTSEIMLCLQTMFDYANAHNIRCFITTTQPRDGFVQPAERQKLKDLKILIEATFGVYAIDFWTGIVQDPPIIIKPEYALGDGVHLNPAGHTVLKNAVIMRDIFFAPVASIFENFSVSKVDGKTRLFWQTYLDNVESYRVERKTRQNNFALIDQVASNNANGEYVYFDVNPLSGLNIYRIGLVRNGTVTYSEIKSVEHEERFKVYPTINSGLLYINTPSLSKRQSVYLVDRMGKTAMIGYLGPSTETSIQKFDISTFPKGYYYLFIRHSPGIVIPIFRY